MLTALGFGLIGVWDDWRKLRRRKKGLSARLKFGLQLLLALALVEVVFWEPARDGWQPVLAIPFLKGWLVNLGWWWLPFAMLVVVGASNAVNLTDGLDGLAIGPVIMAGGAFGVIACLTGNFRAADYLKIVNVKGAGELTVFCGALDRRGHRVPLVQLLPGRGVHGRRRLPGAWGLHRHARRYSPSPSCCCRSSAVSTSWKPASVMIQVASFKLTGRRVFRMAPLHHHFELSGWAEPKIVIRFWIVSFALALLALTTLKLR